MKGILSQAINTAGSYLLGFAIAVTALIVLRRVLTGRAKSIVTWVGFPVCTIALAVLAGKIGAVMPQVASDSPHARAIDLMKAALAMTALGCVFYEIRRAGERRPITERWKKFVGVTLGVAGILFYFNSLKFGYPHYYHRWDQYHYYMGAKYFPEIGYDGLYKCSAIAQDEIDVAYADVDGTGEIVFSEAERKDNMKPYYLGREVRKSDKKIRNLGGDNLLMKVDDLLANPGQCKDRFTPQRWEQYKHDVAFFSTQCYVDSYWTQMQQDHGYNPPPVWTVAGYYLGNAHEASRGYMQFLAVIDVAYILLAFAAIYWAFGWRIFAVCAIVFGTQASAPFYWTGGALLRQDWLFFFVLSACLIRKKYFAWGAAAMVYAGLLRVFPGLVVIGWLGVLFWQLARFRRITLPQKRMLVGGTSAAVILIAVSLAVVGKNSYNQFFKHTIEVHDQTPLTNHMGLRVLIGHDVGFDKSSGRMRYTKDGTKTDPFETWKYMRVERYIDYKPVAYALLATTFFAMIVVLRRLKNMWVAQAIGGIWIILLSQLTCYYYSYMLMCGTLTRLRRDLEVYLFAFAFVTQLGWRTIGMNDDRYDYLTLISLIMSYVLMLAFAPKERTPEAQRAAPLQGEQGHLSLKPWMTLSGPVLGAIVAFVPGLVMVVMGLIPKLHILYRQERDWSGVLIGAMAMVTGIALWAYAAYQRGTLPGFARFPVAAPPRQNSSRAS